MEEGVEVRWSSRVANREFRFAVDAANYRQYYTIDEAMAWLASRPSSECPDGNTEQAARANALRHGRMGTGLPLVAKGPHWAFKVTIAPVGAPPAQAQAQTQARRSPLPDTMAIAAMAAAVRHPGQNTFTLTHRPFLDFDDPVLSLAPPPDLRLEANGMHAPHCATPAVCTTASQRAARHADAD